MAKRSIDRAKAAKKDEFYTQLEDINNELRHYHEHFRGKTVLCNCDDPRVSNFFTYFAYNDLVPSYDPEGAKKLLAEAGYPDGFTMSLYIGSTTYREKMAG